MTIREALDILNSPWWIDRYALRDHAELSPAYREETKELDEKINKINAKIEKLKADIDKIMRQKKVILDRYADAEKERHKEKIKEAREVIAAADRLIAEEMKRTEDKEEKQNDT